MKRYCFLSISTTQSHDSNARNLELYEPSKDLCGELELDRGDHSFIHALPYRLPSCPSTCPSQLCDLHSGVLSGVSDDTPGKMHPGPRDHALVLA